MQCVHGYLADRISEGQCRPDCTGRCCARQESHLPATLKRSHLRGRGRVAHSQPLPQRPQRRSRRTSTLCVPFCGAMSRNARWSQGTRCAIALSFGPSTKCPSPKVIVPDAAEFVAAHILSHNIGGISTNATLLSTLALYSHERSCNNMIDTHSAMLYPILVS